MEALFDGIPLDKVTTSMTINATAALLLLLYQLAGEKQGVDPAALGGTIQNDILKEYIARGTYIFPPRHSMRLVTDIFAYCGAHLPQWNTISISGYHIREAGSTAVQELAFTLANAIAYVEAAQAAGLHIDQLRAAPELLLQRPQRLLRGGRQVPRRARAVGAHHQGALRGDQPARHDAALPHADGRLDADRAAAAQQRGARGRCRRWPPYWAGRRACTPTATTRRWACRPPRRPRWRCARSRSSPTRPA